MADVISAVVVLSATRRRRRLVGIPKENNDVSLWIFLFPTGINRAREIVLIRWTAIKERRLSHCLSISAARDLPPRWETARERQMCQRGQLRNIALRCKCRADCDVRSHFPKHGIIFSDATRAVARFKNENKVARNDRSGRARARKNISRPPL